MPLDCPILDSLVALAQPTVCPQHPQGDSSMQHKASFLRMQDSTQAETLPIEKFEPLLRRLMAQPRNSIYKAALKTPTAV